MFKYTAPWQVLCLSLDQHKRLSSAGRQDDLSSVRLSSSVQSSAHLPCPDPLAARAVVMDSTPRRWVLRPLSPSLQPSDLRSISAQQDDTVFFNDSISIVGSSQSTVYVEAHNDLSANVVVEARQVSVSQEGGSRSSSSSSSEELPVSPCSSSSGASHSGFYSFVDDPFSPEAEQNEAWMVSPQRQTQLATLREDNSYKLQSYSSHRRPASLFQEESTDLRYKIDAKYGYEVVGEQEERQLRKEIIRNQAPKKSPLIEEDGGSSFGNDTSRLIEGLSISYTNVSAKPNVVINSGAIDEEQINFDVARKQFLQMEQNKMDPIIQPRKIRVKTSPKQNATPQEDKAGREEQVSRTKVEDVVNAKLKEDQSGRSRQSSFLEESDVLLVNLGVTFISDDGLNSEQIPPENDTSQFSIEQETPIEREIRIAQEREENLRRLRGLQHSVSGEMVEIKTTRLQSPLPLTPLRAKEKGRVSFIFQDIQKKEEAARQDGAWQDVGSLRRERAHSFEILEANSTEDDATQRDQGYAITQAFGTLKESVGEKFDVVDYALQKQNTQGGSFQESRLLQEYVEPYLRNARQDQEEKNRFQSEQELGRKAEFEDIKSLEEQWQSPNQNVDRIENGFTSAVERSREDSISDDVFLLPCCPHKHPEDSESVKQNGPSRLNLHTPSWRNSLEQTGLQTRGQGAADFIENDIEEALRREQELREQRETQAKQVYSPPTLVQQADKMAARQFYPQIRTDKAQFRSSSSPRPGMRLSSIPLMSPQPWSPAPHTPQTPQTPQTPTVVRTAPLPVRGLAHTLLHDFEERRVKLRLEESAYAGIQPVDSVNNEVVESTRVTRHKNRRALQWEAGLFANQQGQ